MEKRINKVTYCKTTSGTSGKISLSRVWLRMMGINPYSEDKRIELSFDEKNKCIIIRKAE